MAVITDRRRNFRTSKNRTKKAPKRWQGLVNDNKLCLILKSRLKCKSWTQLKYHGSMYMVALIFQRRDTVFLNDLPITRVCIKGFISNFDSKCPKQCSIGRTWWLLQYLTFTILFWDQNSEHWWFSVCFPGSLPLKGRVTCCYVVKYENCATFMHDKMGMQCKYFIITMCICSFGPSFKYLHSQIIKNIIYTCQKVFSKTSTFFLSRS